MSSSVPMPASIAKLCAPRKQHIASAARHSAAVTRKTLNAILAENLTRILEERGLSDSQVARIAGVAANTVGNYKRGASEFTSSGKERSAKLTEVESIARALGVPPIQLLTDADERRRLADAIAASVRQQLGADDSDKHGPLAA